MLIFSVPSDRKSGATLCGILSVLLSAVLALRGPLDCFALLVTYLVESLREGIGLAGIPVSTSKARA
jgi:hypothetical protein